MIWISNPNLVKSTKLMFPLAPTRFHGGYGINETVPCACVVSDKSLAAVERLHQRWIAIAAFGVSMHLVYAPNVRAGGGLVLLQALMTAWNDGLKIRAILDLRAKHDLQLPAGVSVEWISPGVPARLHAEWRLRAAVLDGENILCFHGLPPLFIGKSARSRITVFLQNRLVIEKGSLRAYPFKMRMRLRFERWLFRRKVQSIGNIIVQSLSMKRALNALVGAGTKMPRVQVRPLVPNDLDIAAVGDKRVFDFIYPATGEAHKNHEILVEAWEYLKQDGICPRLALTLGPQDDELWAALKVRIDNCGLAVANLGTVTRRSMADIYSLAGALIVPSTTESFGLPLAEAVRLNLPILAGELDYVRDVCDPIQTFDPNSPISIARAVRRYLGQDEGRIPFEAPESFWSALAIDPSKS